MILSGLSHPDMPDETGWAVYYTSKGVHKERKALEDLNAQVWFEERACSRTVASPTFVTCSSCQGVGGDSRWQFTVSPVLRFDRCKVTGFDLTTVSLRKCHDERLSLLA